MSQPVWVLGAGFSRAIDRRMPLMADLRDDLLSAPGIGTREFKRDLKRAGGDIERLLTRLAADQPWLSDSENLHNRARFVEISRAIGSLITERQVEVVQTHAGGPPDAVAKLVRYWTNHRSTVVTFNYDTLVERAYGAAHIDARGHPRHHSLLMSVRATPVATRLGGAWGTSEESGFTLLKLHGSIGLGYSGSLSPSETIWDLTSVAGWASDAWEWQRIAGDLVPLIVPPTFSKGPRDFDHGFIRAQWRLAAERLRDAKSVVVIGYSLPAGDYVVRDMVAEAELDRITIIDVREDAPVAFRGVATEVELRRADDTLAEALSLVAELT